MKVLLTGASGFVGTHVQKALLDDGHTIRCLVHSKKNIPRQTGVETVTGDITQPNSLKQALKDCDAIIHLVAIIEENKSKGITFDKLNLEGTVNLADTAVKNGVNRFIYISALGADPNGPTAYFQSKGKAEEYIKDSPLIYTIFRPSFIYGQGDAVYSMLSRVIQKTPYGIYPLFGNGLYRHQPVWVQHVSKGITNALSEPLTYYKTYNVGGPEQLTFKKQLEILAEITNSKIRFLSLPLWLSKWIAAIGNILPLLPIDSDRLKMLTQDNVCNASAFYKELKIKPVFFKDILSRELNEITGGKNE